MELLNGDCLELMRGIPDGSVDMVLTDPPYGTTDCTWECKIDLDAMWAQLKRVLKPNGAAVIFSQLPFAVDVINANRKMFRYEWIWEKNCPRGFLNAKKMPMRVHENLLVFYRQLPTYNPQKEKSDRHAGSRVHNTSTVYSKYEPGVVWTDDGTRYPKDIIQFQPMHGNSWGHQDEGIKAVHPTQKPVALLEYMIKTYTNEGDTVLDCFAGSGSTGVAAVNLWRNFIGIEKDAGYFEAAQLNIGMALDRACADGGG